MTKEYPRFQELKIRKVIEVQTLVGEGTEENPNRYKFIYYDLDGKLLAENDTWRNE